MGSITHFRKLLKDPKTKQTKKRKRNKKNPDQNANATGAGRFGWWQTNL
jgi:hypothetical protein